MSIRKQRPCLSDPWSGVEYLINEGQTLQGLVGEHEEDFQSPSEAVQCGLNARISSALLSPALRGELSVVPWTFLLIRCRIP